MDVDPDPVKEIEADPDLAKCSESGSATLLINLEKKTGVFCWETLYYLYSVKISTLRLERRRPLLEASQLRGPYRDTIPEQVRPPQDGQHCQAVCQLQVSFEVF